MKNYTVLAVVVALCSWFGPAGAFAQHTLQFNQVKLVSTVETVPTGKVWKIESMLPSSRLTTYFCTNTSSCGYAQTQHIILVNGTSVYMASSDVSGEYAGYATSALTLNTTIWLPEGTTLAAGTGVYSISVIEFNLIAP